MTTYARFAARYHDHFTSDPNECVEKGVDARLGELPDPSLAWSERRVGSARGLLAELDRVETAGLGFDERLDLDLARLALEADIHARTHRWNGRTQLQQTPRAGRGIGDGIFLLLAYDPRPDGERLADITARIEQVPAYLEAMLGRLDTPVARWTRMDLDEVAGLPQLFATVCDRAEELAWPDLPRLRRARAAAEAALARYAEGLGRLPTTQALHVGAETARRVVALRGIERSLEQLHRMAADFLAEIRETVAALRGRLARKYGLDGDIDVAELHRWLLRRFRVEAGSDPMRVLARYEQERARILAFIREHDLFPIPDEQDMRLLRTPGFMAPTVPAGAMMPPAPFRPGLRTSLVYLTLAEELLDEHTELGIPGMMIHEGIPGHHLQLATASLHPSIIRRHFNATEHGEGWTTMLEDYMLDVGYMGELADEARFVGKRDLARIGARVAIDLFFMTGERGYLDVGVECDLSPADPFEAAGNLLEAVTGFVPARVQTELNWYSLERGYPLSYLAGNRLVWELKRDLAEAQRGKLEGLALDRVFHEIYLRSGNMPLAFLRRVFVDRGLLPCAPCPR